MAATNNDSHLVNGLHHHIPDFLKPKKYDIHKESREVEMLEVKLMVHKGENLAAMDHVLGFIPTTSDPYCKIRFLPKGPGNIGGESVLYLGKTKVQKGTLNPKWNQVFSATVPKDSVQADALFELRVYDKDNHSKDDPMGVVFVPIYRNCSPDSTQQICKEDWYQVRKDSSGKQGQGKLQCSVKLTQTTQTICETVGMPKEHYFAIKVRVIQAEGLPKTDKNVLGMASAGDPYVIVRLMNDGDDNPNGVVLGKTEFQSNEQNPHWDEVFSTRLPIDELDHHATIQLKLKDRNNSQTDDLLGIVQVPIRDLRRTISPDKPSVKATEWYNIPKDSAKHAQGRVQCKVTLTLLMADSKPSP